MSPVPRRFRRCLPHRAHHALGEALVLVAALWALYVARPAAAACTCPQVTRAQIIDVAKTGVGCPYVWGGTCWDPANKSWKGADCSGYVTKCWQVPAASATTSCLAHYFTTDTFYNQTTHWTNITRAELLPGDALVYRSGDAGHIVIFDALTTTSGSYEVYEARGTAYGIVHRVKAPDSSYQPRRRHNLLTAPPPPPPGQPPRGTLEAVDCTALRGWAQDPDVKTSAIAVHVYVDGVPGQPGAVAYQVKADVNRSDLCASLGSCNHGFTMPTPAKFKDGKPHVARVYAIDDAGGQNPELAQSGRPFTCASVGDAGPQPLPLDAGGSPGAPDVGNLPPSFEVPDDSRDERDLTLRGTAGCSCAVPAAPADACAALLGLLVLAAAHRAARHRSRAAR